MEIYREAKSLFPSDLETNLLLRLHIERNILKSYKRRRPNKIALFFAKILVGGLYGFVKGKPKYRKTIFKLGRKLLPVFLKIRIKYLLSFLTEGIEDLDGIYELNYVHPRSLERGFGLSTSTSPEVSIIIPVHNHIKTTLNLLNQLRLNSDETKFEVLVVDDASTDSTSKYLEKLRGIHVLTQTKNVGYLRATNSAIKFCKGELICLLNNDTIPESGWLDALVRAIKNDPKTAIVGSMLIGRDGQVAEAGSQIFKNREIWNLGSWGEAGDQLFNFTREVDYCSAASILVDGKFLRARNGFDERFAPAYFEDTDLATTAWHAGRRVVYVHDSVVHHIGGLSHDDKFQKGINTYGKLSKQKYWQKWGDDINLTWEFDEIPRFEADRDSRGIVIFIDNFIPSENENAGAARAFRIVEAMRKLKFHVVIVPENPGTNIVTLEKLRRNGVEVYQSYDAAVANLKLRKFRIKNIWLSRIDVAQLMLPRIKRDFPNIPIYFDTVDLHHVRDKQNINLNGKRSAIYESNIEEIELEVCKLASKVIVVADYERQYLLEKNSGINAHTLFMPHEAKSLCSGVGKKSYILFVGSFRHQPNLDGIIWLLEEVLPKLEAMTDEIVKLHIVGESLPQSIIDTLDINKVKYLGWVESLDQQYNLASVVVIPLRYGAGKKGKVAEAIVNGCPIVSTSVGAEGYPLIPDEDFLLADNSEAFAQAILELWNSENSAFEKVTSAKAKLQTDSTLQKFTEQLSEILEIN
jgi:GT2 family glycosyltransferase